MTHLNQKQQHTFYYLFDKEKKTRLVFKLSSNTFANINPATTNTVCVEALFTLMEPFTGYCHLPGRLLLPLGADCVPEKQWIIGTPM